MENVREMYEIMQIGKKCSTNTINLRLYLWKFDVNCWNCSKISRILKRNFVEERKSNWEREREVKINKK